MQVNAMRHVCGLTSLTCTKRDYLVKTIPRHVNINPSLVQELACRAPRTTEPIPPASMSCSFRVHVKLLLNRSQDRKTRKTFAQVLGMRYSIEFPCRNMT